ncbi:MAG: N4-gp56 family major capsid protein [Mycoplasma sp.]|nr:N4-gp56 family major capsid protein [Mycoplasma sp.]
MADAPTQVSSVSSVQAAYDRFAYFALREQLYFDNCADIRSTSQDKPGSSVTFTVYADLAPAITPLSETADVDAVEITDSQVTVTLDEYGNAALTTARVRGESYLNVDEDVANIVGFNAGQSLDRLARPVLFGGTNVQFSGQTTQAAITATDLLTAAMIREGVAKLRGRNVIPIDSHFKGFLHPDVRVDLQAETGEAAWNAPAIRNEGAQRVWLGLVGNFAGTDWIEAPSCPILADAGASTVDVYQSVIVGRQSLAKAYSRTVSSELPGTVIGPVVDKLKRFRPVGWYWLGGYGRFREASLQRLEAASSIGDN